MTDQPAQAPMTLTEAAGAGVFIPATQRFQPQGETHMGLGRDPATMEFEVQPNDAADTAAVVAEIQEGETDGLAALIELSESPDGEWLLLPVGEYHQFRVAKRLPHRRLQRLIQLVREQKQIQESAGGDLMSLADDALARLLDATANILGLVLCPDDVAAFESGLDDLRHPVDTASMGRALQVVLPRYMRGVGGATGKLPDSSPTQSPSPTT